MQESYFDARGIYYRFGNYDKDRLTLIFLHGLSGNLAAWRLFEKNFIGRYNVLLVDLRGHGKSKKPRHYRDYNLIEFAEDIDELIRHLEIKKFSLISHSFGTLVALEYLLKYHHKVDSTIFLSPNYGIHRTRRARITRPAIMAVSRGVDLLPFRGVAGIDRDYSKYMKTVSGDWDLLRMASDISNTSLRVYLYCLEHVYSFNRDSWWGRIKIPTLIIHGKIDSVVPLRNVMEMAKSIPHSKLALIEDANHVIVLNNQKEIVSHIEEFLTV